MLRKLYRLLRHWSYVLVGLRPYIYIHPLPGIKFYGTDYGKWPIFEVDALFDSSAIMILCGVGEDITFDISLASKYKVKEIFLLDPTPRAVSHYKKVIDLAFGCSIDNEIYDMYTPFGIDQLKHVPKLIEKAIWTKTGTVDFFQPYHIGHVSHSIYGIHSKTSGKISVPSISYRDLISSLSIDKITFMKLDIEGAECDVILSMSKEDILPDQFAIEYDLLRHPSFGRSNKVRMAHKHLLVLGYVSVWKDPVGVVYLYVRSESFR